MKSNLAVKVITLSGFTILMSGFVAYKAGALETTSDLNADSPVKDSLTPVIFAPSSKSGPVISVPGTRDTVKPKQQQQQENTQKNPAPDQNNKPANQNTEPPKPNHYMGGSKSHRVYSPEPKDTSKPK